MPRASLLLLAYSAEMYLKSGLIKNFSHCRVGLIDREIKAYGHDLVRITTDVNFQMTALNTEHLQVLAKLLVDARYPVEPPTKDGWEGQVEYIDKVNERTGRTWNKHLFAEFCRLVQRIRLHVERIDGDEKNPSSFRHAALAKNGYITLRYGGNLAPRVTYRDEDDRVTTRTVAEIEELALELGWLEAKHYWPMFSIILDGKKKTTVLHQAQ